MKNKTKDIVQFLYEIGTLRKIPRAHMQTLLTSDLSDNISSHSFRVTMIGWMLAVVECADVDKVIKMCLLHDLTEARSGDMNWVHKNYVKVYEDEISSQQVKELPDSKNFNKIITEYNKRQSIEAKIAKDADLLDQELLLKEYVMQGNQEAAGWLKRFLLRNKMSTDTARKWAVEIKKQSPSEWWDNIWTSERR